MYFRCCGYYYYGRFPYYINVQIHGGHSGRTVATGHRTSGHSPPPYAEHIKFPIETENKFSEWLNKADIAHKERLGAGAVIYLRSILEKITIKVGNDAGVDIYKSNGKTKSFEQVIKAVDKECAIIPVIYSDNGYELFRRMSEIAHGNSDEDTAIKEYEPLRRLVVGILENIQKKETEIKNNAEIKKALDAIGFSDGGEQSEQTE